MSLAENRATSGQLDPKSLHLFDDVERELTRAERKAIRKLVTNECANHCREYGCLQLNDACFMLGKCWTGAYCKYFRNAVLPLDPMLESALTSKPIETRTCSICDTEFPVIGKQRYCSDICAGNAQRKRNKEYMRKKRGG